MKPSTAKQPPITAAAWPRHIVVTGATQVLGRALVELLARQGHRLAGCGRNRDAVLELRRRLGDQHRFAVVDVADWDQTSDWANGLAQDWGTPDLLLNNAAVINRSAPLWEIAPAEFREVIEINLIGAANVMRAFVPAMIQKRRGVIVNFSSGWGRSSAPKVAPYCATKWGIEGLTQALSQELPAGLAAVALNPGIIDTAMLRSCVGEAAGHYPNPPAWATAAVPFLLSLGPDSNGMSLDIP